VSPKLMSSYSLLIPYFHILVDANFTLPLLSLGSIKITTFCRNI
jgi:hypothetical protein